jgi:hypothetical protein
MRWNSRQRGAGASRFARPLPTSGYEAPPVKRKIQELVKIKCIGPEFATALVSEVFYPAWRRIKSGYWGAAATVGGHTAPE